MFDLIFILIPILVADIINPVLLAAVIFALGSQRAIINSLAVLSGWFVLYFISGIVLSLCLEAISKFLANPRPVDFYIEVVVGVMLVWLALHSYLKEAPRKKEKDFGDESALKPHNAFMIGAGINLIGLPFAIPYFAALDQIMKADFVWQEAVIALLAYNLLYILPFAAFILLKFMLGNKSDQILQTINQKMEKTGDFLFPLLILVIGLALITDAIYYFITSNPLF